MIFDIQNPEKLIIGNNSLQIIKDYVPLMGRSAMVVTGRDKSRAYPLIDMLAEMGILYMVYPISGEPSISTIQEGLLLSQGHNLDMVIAIGGGSVIDTGKALSALIRNKGDILDYLEVVGNGEPLSQLPLPLIAIPTTAGTGSEVTKNAVIFSPEHGVKVSLRSPLLIPDLVILDPMLTASCPPTVTALSGLDALTQVMEPFLSKKANPYTDMLCREGLRLVSKSLLHSYEDGTDLESRMDMSMASLLGGLALANAGLGVVHGFAGPLGGMFNAPHGGICAAILPHAMKKNLEVAQSNPELQSTVTKYQEIAAILTNNKNSLPEDGVSWVSLLCHSMNVPRLFSYGIREYHFVSIVEKARKASSMKSNPFTLSDKDLEQILFNSL